MFCVFMDLMLWRVQPLCRLHFSYRKTLGCVKYARTCFRGSEGVFEIGILFWTMRENVLFSTGYVNGKHV